MKREEIKEIIEGITKEQLDRIMEINGNDIEKAKSNVSTLQEQVTNLTAQLNERDKQLQELKETDKNNEKLQNKITELEQSNASVQSEYEAKIKALQDDYELEGKLRSDGARNIKAVKALLDKDKSYDEQIKALKENEDTSFLFQSKEVEVTPPKGTAPSTGNVTPSSNEPLSLSAAISKALNMKG